MLPNLWDGLFPNGVRANGVVRGRTGSSRSYCQSRWKVGNGGQGMGSKGVGRIGANVDSNPRPRWAIDRKIYLNEVGGANHPLPCSSTVLLLIALSATSPWKSLRLTFCSNSVRRIKFSREVVSNILCSTPDSVLPHGWDSLSSRHISATITTCNFAI